MALAFWDVCVPLTEFLNITLYLFGSYCLTKQLYQLIHHFSNHLFPYICSGNIVESDVFKTVNYHCRCFRSLSYEQEYEAP